MSSFLLLRMEMPQSMPTFMIDLSCPILIENWEATMCNLYNVTTTQEAIRQFTEAAIDGLGNLEPSLDIYPDYKAPIVRNTPKGREMAMVRWGLPSSRKALLDAATKRADKLRAKGKVVDFDQLLRMEPDGGRRTFATRQASIGSDGSGSSTDVSCR